MFEELGFDPGPIPTQPIRFEARQLPLANTNPWAQHMSKWADCPHNIRINLPDELNHCDSDIFLLPSMMTIMASLITYKFEWNQLLIYVHLQDYNEQYYNCIV